VGDEVIQRPILLLLLFLDELFFLYGVKILFVELLELFTFEIFLLELITLQLLLLALLILSFSRGDFFNLLFDNIFFGVGDTFSLNSMNSAFVDKFVGENKEEFEEAENGEEQSLFSSEEIASYFLLPFENDDVEYFLLKVLLTGVTGL